MGSVQPVLFTSPLDNGVEDALLALKEIDALKIQVNEQLVSLKKSMDGQIER